MYDILIIGGGVIGCSIARRLSRYDLKTILLEKKNDVCECTSCANSAIVHSGYDPKPGSLKAKLNVEGNQMFDQICFELDVPFSRIGSITLALDEEEMGTLIELQDRARQNGVDVKILNQEELFELEPNVTRKAVGGLLAPTAGIINPFELTYANMENAMDNGVELALSTEVNAITRKDGYYQVSTSKGTYEAKYVINAGGVYADKINDMVNEHYFDIKPRRGEYIVLDHFDNAYVKHTLFNLPSKKGKGVLFSPTTHFNYLIGPSADFIEGRDDVATTIEGIKGIKNEVFRLVDNPQFGQQIRTFSGLRAYSPHEDFIIEERGKGFINVAGIQSPGLASSPAIARMVCDMIDNKSEKKDYNPYRRKVVRLASLGTEERMEFVNKNPLYGNIICRCETISEGEIVDCIHRNCGATTIKGVKKRCRPGMGKCQGGFCQGAVLKILARELNKTPEEIMYGDEGSYIFASNLNKEVK